MFQKLIEDFGNIKIQLTNEEKINIINNQKNLHNINDEDIENINFNDIFNNKILFDRALNSMNKINYSNKNIKQHILDMEDNNNYNLAT